MGLLHLSGLLAQLELEKLLAGLARPGGNLSGRESRIFFEVMTVVFLEQCLGRKAVALDEAAVERQLRVGETKCLLDDGQRNTGEFEQDGAWLDDGDVELDRALCLVPFGLRRASS